MQNDRFRALLSLLGVAVGIFSIVTALTLVDAIQKTVREGFSAYGSDLLFVDRMPLEPDLNEDGVFRWWEYAARPDITWREYRYLEERGAAEKAYGEIAFASYGHETVGVEGDWQLLVRQPLAEGRAFTPRELAQGEPVAVVGSEVEARCGQALWFDGVRYEIIGRFSKSGINTVSPVDVDNACLVPCKTQRVAAIRSSIILSGADAGKVRTLMREYRRLGPLQEDDFSLNRLSYLLDEMNDLFAMVSRLGWIVGLFSLLVGGFGIANMLYVSVQERKVQIGICRALGAKRRVIVREFLAESAQLSLLGGGVGILLVQAVLAIVSLVVGRESGLPLVLSPQAALTGLAVSLAIGLIFGVAPARAASRLSPVEAMRG